ncbi:MAG: lipopolysaccharide transport periplasmic protein LptA [Syntrophus sp. (in: bacteria)]|nr:lipopolysaccharide transport periplasmic protein LptA [Syntrophus sp. (in: bacteria)]
MKNLFIILISCIILVSCASKPPAKKAEGPGDLYVEGVNLMKKKKWDDAIKKFNTVRENYPFDSLSLVAAVKLGDVYFEKKNYVQAASVYEDFFNAHPGDASAPYALARLGECYEKLSPTLDRDQAQTFKAIEKYTLLKNRYASSSYAKIVDERVKILTQKLADRELYVGEFYYKTFEYNASVIRLEYMLKKYPEMTGKDKALYYLSMSYKGLGILEKSDFYADKLKSEYPKSIFARTNIRERKTLKVAQTDQPSVQPAVFVQPMSGQSVPSKQKREIILTPVAAQTATPGPEKAAPIKDAAKETKEKEFDFFDKSKPIDIVSDTMEGIDKEKYVIFKGNVIAKQEDLYIFADIIEAYLNEESNEIDRAIAKSNVKIVKKDRTATADEANFDNKKGEIILKGNVVVFQGQDKLSGDVVTYYVNEDRAVVTGDSNKKARVILNPR